MELWYQAYMSNVQLGRVVSVPLASSLALGWKSGLVRLDLGGPRLYRSILKDIDYCSRSSVITVVF